MQLPKSKLLNHHMNNHQEGKNVQVVLIFRRRPRGSNGKLDGLKVMSQFLLESRFHPKNSRCSKNSTHYVVEKLFIQKLFLPL